MLEFSIRHCRVQVQFLALALLTALLLTAEGEKILLSLLAAAIHEAGHLLVMLLCRVPPTKIVIRPGGIWIQEQAAQMRSYAVDTLIALGGPLANGWMMGVSFCLPQSESVQLFLLANGVLGAWNLLPMEGLDGGRILGSLLCRWNLPAVGDRLLRIVSFVFLLPLTTLGFWMLLRHTGGGSLLLVTGYLALQLFRREG